MPLMRKTRDGTLLSPTTGVALCRTNSLMPLREVLLIPSHPLRTHLTSKTLIHLSLSWLPMPAPLVSLWSPSTQQFMSSTLSNSAPGIPPHTDLHLLNISHRISQTERSSPRVNVYAVSIKSALLWAHRLHC